MRRVLLVIVLMALSFASGYWLQHTKLKDAQMKTVALSTLLSNAEATIHLCQLQDELLPLIQQTGNKDDGDAAAISTKFLDNTHRIPQWYASHRI